jgi:hypothetical protein
MKLLVGNGADVRAASKFEMRKERRSSILCGIEA